MTAKYQVLTNTIFIENRTETGGHLLQIRTTPSSSSWAIMHHRNFHGDVIRQEGWPKWLSQPTGSFPRTCQYQGNENEEPWGSDNE
ncbi:hypothetical protein CEXT_461381 [Caerostris extrusa]|uniref:Uncharacterized protein n=1 Tax=Caerostris extrusa TaxID=172846 RepID=A0AAV4XMZ9_CAEEX|nr:hypothetical protein CEXT_461381 [Caerostris extrusa]